MATTTRGGATSGVEIEGGTDIAAIEPYEREWLKRGQSIVLRLKPEYAWPTIPDEATDLVHAAAVLLRESDPHVVEERTQLYTVLKAVTEGEPVARVCQSRPPSWYYSREKEAATGELPPVASLSQYWRVDTKKMGASERYAGLLRLRRLDAVELAYVDPPGRSTAVTADPFSGDGTTRNTPIQRQYYLDGDGIGVNARAAWALGASGSGSFGAVRFVDLEYDWLPEHIDLPFATTDAGIFLAGDNAYNPSPLAPIANDGSHGTAVLGIVVAKDNGVGVVGIAPGAETRLVSRYKASDGTDLNVADGILASLAYLGPGDVLLLEFERTMSTGTFGPTEIVPVDFDAIRLAVSSNIIVIEAAGNGATNLDTVAGLSKTDPDSGAIMVGACTPVLTPAVLDLSSHSAFFLSAGNGTNYGGRVDCFSWGANVVTCGPARPGGNTLFDASATAAEKKNMFRDDFNGTSSASAIIAGTAILASAYYRTSFANQPISPLILRDLFRQSGVLNADNVARPIGRMPDLSRVFTDLGLVADVYVRDTVADTGDVPSAGIACLSPDIIVVSAPVASPDGSFGESSGHANDSNLSDPVTTVGDRYVYVRVQNRGGLAATDVRARVYYADAGTLITPGMWTEIGLSDPRDVPANDEIVVLGPIPWLQADIPGPGHYCFVAVVGGTEDPMPQLPAGNPTPLDWFQFVALVQDNNNVAWRNFDVVVASGAARMRFNINGAPDKARDFDLEIRASLPTGSLLKMDLPAGFLMTMKSLGYKGTTSSVLTLPSRGVLTLPTARLGPKDKHPATFIVTPPPKSPFRRSQGARIASFITIRQLYKGFEVGRVTFEVRFK